jgi:hypothetical protein
MVKYIFSFLFLITFQLAFSQTHSISGYVEDLMTGERVIGANVVDNIGKNAVQTNNYGFYTLRNVGEKVALQAIYFGNTSKIKELTLRGDTLVNLSVRSVKELNEVVVVSSKYNNNINNRLGSITIPVKQLTSLPALGEPDLLKSIQSQAGIKGGVEGSAGIFVRGGGGGENLFMLDEVPIYNVSHLYGFFSAFNPSAVKDIKLIKGCFPARYGGRASSVVDVRCLDGNNKSVEGEFSLGFISSRFTLEGPLLNDKTTFLISGRRSYFDIYSNSLKSFKILAKDFPDYYFYDLNARIAHTFSQKDKIYLSIYKGKDNIQNKNESSVTTGKSGMSTESSNETSGWGNLIGSFRWNHTYGTRLFVNTTFSYSSYNYFSDNHYVNIKKDTTSHNQSEKSMVASYRSNISDIMVKTDFNFALSGKQNLTFGAGNTFHTIQPGENHYVADNLEINEKIDTSYTNRLINASEPFSYVEDEINATGNLTIYAGLRLSGFLSKSNRWFNLEPRLSANYTVSPGLVLKAGYSRMVQYMHLLSSSGVSMPTDLWVPAANGLLPLKTDQINIGFGWDWGKKLLFSVDMYQKWLTNTTDIRDGMSLITDLAPWYNKTAQGHGISKGIELSVDKQQGRWKGSFHYTLSSADRIYSEINNGQSFPFKFDRRHDLNISVNYQISQKWDVSAMWFFGSGYPVTLPIERYAPALRLWNFDTSWGDEIGYNSSRNNCRLPAYHRLDLGIHYKKTNRLGKHGISFDVFNAYNRHNPVNAHFYFYTPVYTYLLPCIPSVTYTLKF